MGIIKDGSISGVLPSSKEAFAVFYPGYPTSTERAVESLGGTEAILKVRSGKSKNLELNFCPEDPFSHSALGRRTSSNNFLLRISKRGKTVQRIEDLDRVSEQLPGTSQQTIRPQCESVLASSEVEGQIQDGSEEQLCADIVARVSEAYHFNGMSDYQYNPKKRRRICVDTESQFEKDGLMDVDQDINYLVPPRFSAKDRPEHLVFKKSVDVSSRKKQEGVVQQSAEMDIEQCLAIDFNIKDIPKKVNWETSIDRESDLWRWQKVVCELFEERPVWVKSSLLERLLDQGLNITKGILKRILVVAAYYFSNGPFLRFWIRKGYDPRKDPESRIYQRIDFRVHPSLRSYCDTNTESGLKNRWEDICAFQVFPHKCQTSLQLFELKDDYIQQEIRKPANGGNCSLQTGWFSARMLDTLRLRVSMRFLSVYPEAGAESLLKSVSNSFEKAKRMPIDLKDKKVNEEEKQANKGELESENKEPNDEVQYEEGEEEEQEEEEEEEQEEEEDKEEEEDDDDDEMDNDIPEEGLGTEDAPDLDDQYGNFLLQLDSHNGNISKEYLQGLFDSCPFNADDGEMQDAADPHIEEFQIYAQYSDDNYSDDE